MVDHRALCAPVRTQLHRLGPAQALPVTGAQAEPQPHLPKSLGVLTSEQWPPVQRPRPRAPWKAPELVLSKQSLAAQILSGPSTQRQVIPAYPPGPQVKPIVCMEGGRLG